MFEMSPRSIQGSVGKQHGCRRVRQRYELIKVFMLH